METLDPPRHETLLSPDLKESIAKYCDLQSIEWQQRNPGIQIGGQEVFDEMKDNYSLLEPVGSNEVASEQAAMTVCIPVALMQEDQSTIDRVLSSIKGSQQELGERIDIILWANAPTLAHDNSQKRGLRQRVAQRRAASKKDKRYKELRDSADKFESDGMRIKTAFKNIGGQPDISQIRSDYMEAATLDALKQGYGPEHPILWLDADTTYLSKNALGKLNEKVRSGDSLFVHAAERFTTEWADGVPVSKRDPATRAIMIDEIHRRKFAKQLHKQGKRIGYPEESGLAFSLGTYLELGGVNTQDEVNESSNLLAHGKQLLLDGEVERYPAPNARSGRRLPRDLPNLIEYVPAARMGLSARRLRDKVETRGANGLWRPRQASDTTYELHTSAKAKNSKHTQPVTKEGMHSLLKSKASFYTLGKREHELSEKENRIMSSLIEKSFKD